MPTNYPTALDTTTQLPTTRAENTPSGTNHAADHNNADAAIVAVETKLGSGASVPSNIGDVLAVSAGGSSNWQPPGSLSYMTEMFGTLDRTTVPFADLMTRTAIARGYDMPPSVAGYAEATSTETTAAQTAITNAAANTTVQLLRRIYRAQFTGPANTGVIVKGPASIRASDDWSIGGLAGNTWAAAASPNATNGIVSSLTVPTFTVDSSGYSVLTAGHTPTYTYLAANREMVIVDGVRYLRQTANAALAAGQWCFSNDTSPRTVVIYLPGGATGHKIEVVTRQYWATTIVDVTTWHGIDFRHAPSGANQFYGIGNNGFRGLAIVNCMLGFCHGSALAFGNNTESQIVGSVFHNCGANAISGGNAKGTFLRNNVFYNCGGTQTNYANELDISGFDPSWSSGGFKVGQSDSTVADSNFMFNMGATGIWSDISCRYDAIVHNVLWDSRKSFIQYEVSMYGRIAGNVVFQTNSSQFYSDTTNVGINCETSRGVEVGGDSNSGWLEGNLVMRLPTCYNMVWTNSRIGVAEVQSLSAAATSPNTFRLNFGGYQTANLAWNSTAAEIQTALQGLFSIGQGSMVCTGGPSGTAPITMTFAGRVAPGPQALITVSNVSGGGTPVVTEITLGTGDAPLGGFTDMVFHGNIAIARSKFLPGGLTNSDFFWKWQDNVSGADIPTVGANRGGWGYSNAYGFESAGEDPATRAVIVPADGLWVSSLATNQDGGTTWVTMGAVGASRWENGEPLGLSVPLTGTVAKAGTTTLTGTGTRFLTELGIGQIIRVPGTANEYKAVAAIASDTSLTVDIAFAQTASSQVATKVMPLDRQTRWLTLAEQATYLARYGLPLGT